MFFHGWVRLFQSLFIPRTLEQKRADAKLYKSPWDEEALEKPDPSMKKHSYFKDVSAIH
jgi:hypothetical protein